MTDPTEPEVSTRSLRMIDLAKSSLKPSPFVSLMKLFTRLSAVSLVKQPLPAPKPNLGMAIALDAQARSATAALRAYILLDLVGGN